MDKHFLPQLRTQVEHSTIWLLQELPETLVQAREKARSASGHFNPAMSTLIVSIGTTVYITILWYAILCHGSWLKELDFYSWILALSSYHTIWYHPIQHVISLLMYDDVSAESL